MIFVIFQKFLGKDISRPIFLLVDLLQLFTPKFNVIFLRGDT